jgi:indolepyruvate ferredoxin oxidoreductase beta subunit
VNFKAKDIVNVIIAGTAGQGVITLKRLIEFAAQKAGIQRCFGTEHHGLAQREGAIVSHTRYQKELYEDERKNIQSPLISYGDANLYICIEPIETLRHGLFASNITTFAINSFSIPGVMITAGLEAYPSLDKIKESLKRYTDKIYFLNATKLSLDTFNSNQYVNIIMLGFAIRTKKLPFIEIENYEEVIRERLREPENNIRALHLGLDNAKEAIGNY